MALVTAFQLVFAAGVVLTALALAGAGFRLVGRAVLRVLVTAVAVMAVAAWIAFALEPDRDLAVSAGGLTGAALAATVSFALARALARASRMDAELDRVQGRLRELVDAEADERAAELERLLARSRAESLSLLAEQERRIVEERRTAVVERERSAAAELADTLARTQAQVEQRLRDWAQDLERTAEAMRRRLVDLGQRHKQLIADAEARIKTDGDRLQSESEEQRNAVTRLRAEIQRALEETIASARSESDQQAADRRRALHELGERLRRRERELAEQIQREEAEAAARIQAGFADVQRRQLETLERSVARAAAALTDEAAQQFATLIRNGREEAARRLNRELERAVATFAKEAETVLAEQLAHVGDAGARRLERRLSQITTAMERQREEFVQAFESRLTEAEGDLRRRLGELAADAEAERAILEARLQELGRRFDELSAARAR